MSLESMSRRADGLVEVAPGVFVDPSRQHLIAGDKAVAPNFLFLDEVGYRRIGLSRDHRDTVRRLAESGEIRIARISPRLAFLDLNSWQALLERSAADPWYWEDARRAETYRGTYE